ncbi:MAG: hypothetical protein WEF50_06290 [Myxococcota bacterium]
MAVSQRDREYMARIAALKLESSAQALAEHRAQSVDERLRRSWALYMETRASVNVAQREDDPTAFYRLARELGLYRP